MCNYEPQKVKRQPTVRARLGILQSSSEHRIAPRIVQSDTGPARRDSRPIAGVRPCQIEAHHGLPRVRAGTITSLGVSRRGARACLYAISSVWP